MTSDSPILVTPPDPMPAGRLATWLFLASEVMFFVGLLGVFVIYRSTPGNEDLFDAHLPALNKPLAGANTAVLLLSSVTMAVAVNAAWRGRRRRASVALLATLVLGTAFVGVKTYEYRTKLTRYTIVVTDPATKVQHVYDGRAARPVRPGDREVQLRGRRAMVGAGFNIHTLGPADLPPGAGDESFTVPLKGATWTSYGPWKNVVWACYFALTGVHGVHVIGGLAAVAVLLWRAARGRLAGPAVEYVALYWYFVDAVWVVLFPLLYLV